MAKLNKREKAQIEREIKKTIEGDRLLWSGFRPTTFKSKKTDIKSIRRESKKLCREGE